MLLKTGYSLSFESELADTLTHASRRKPQVENGGRGLVKISPSPPHKLYNDDRYMAKNRPNLL